MRGFVSAVYAFIPGASILMEAETKSDDSFAMWLSMILCAAGLAIVLIKHRKK